MAACQKRLDRPELLSLAWLFARLWTAPQNHTRTIHVNHHKLRGSLPAGGRYSRRALESTKY